MSVSNLDTSVSASTIADTLLPPPQGKANRPAPAALAFDAQNAANVNFRTRETQAGPVFGGHQPSVKLGSHDSQSSPDTTAATTRDERKPRFMEQFKQWLSQMFGGHRPPTSSHCNGAPSRPHPGSGAPARPHPGTGAPSRPHPQPKPDYASQNHEQLTQALLDNFNAFTGKNYPTTMTTRNIREMANKTPGNDPVMNNNIRLAKELLKRPDLMQALDRNSGTGAQDHRFSQRDLQSALKDTSFFKYKTDKEVGQEMLSHFDELKEHCGGQISLENLKKLANKPLTGDSAKDHLIQLAQAVLKRSNLLDKIDKNDNGLISKNELKKLLAN